MKHYYKHLIFTILATISISLSAQDIATIWQTVEQNNRTLRAARQQADAECVAHRVGLAPENPEVEFAYLWASPEAINRMDFSVTQSFAFPTTYLYQNRLARLQNQQVELGYQQQCRELQQTVGELYYQILYQNVRINDMQKCGQFLTEATAAYKQKLDNGSITVFDYHKVKLAELNLQQELAHAEAERAGLLLQLQQLNGGVPLEITASAFPELRLPTDFDTWYATAAAQHPALAQLATAQDLQQQQTNLARAAWAPQFFAGYMREQIPTETFQGIKVGLTLPLWNNANTLKQNRLQTSALALLVADEQYKTRAHLQAQYTMVRTLQQQIDEYQTLLSSVDALNLLQEAFRSGQLSLIDYLAEAAIYHESHERLAELQFDAATYYVTLQVFAGFSH